MDQVHRLRRERDAHVEDRRSERDEAQRAYEARIAAEQAEAERRRLPAIGLDALALQREQKAATIAGLRALVEQVNVERRQLTAAFHEAIERADLEAAVAAQVRRAVLDSVEATAKQRLNAVAPPPVVGVR